MRRQDAQNVILRFSLDDFDDDAEALDDELEGEEEASCGLSAVIREDGCLVIAEPVMLTPFGPLGPRLDLGDVIEVEPRSENEYRYVQIIERGNPVTLVLEPIDESVALSQSTLDVLEKFNELEGVWEYGSHRLTIQIPSESDELEELRVELVAVINEQRQSQPDSEGSTGGRHRRRQPLQSRGLRDTQMPCPNCGSKGYSRKTKTPEWRCRKCAHEWDAVLRDKEERCDLCGKRMELREGRIAGSFLACTGFPECRNTKSLLVAVDSSRGNPPHSPGSVITDSEPANIELETQMVTAQTAFEPTLAGAASRANAPPTAPSAKPIKRPQEPSRKYPNGNSERSWWEEDGKRYSGWLIIGCLVLVFIVVIARGQSSDTPELPDAWDLYATGAEYYEDGKWELALEFFTKSIEHDPGQSWAYHYRGITILKWHDYRLAISDFDRAIQLSPNDPTIYIDRGEAYGLLGEYEREKADKSRACELDQYFCR